MGLRIKIGLTIATTAAVASVATGSLMPQLIQDDRRDRVLDQLGAAVKQYKRTGSGVEVDPPGLPPKAREAALNGLTVTYLQEDEPDTWVWAATRDKDGKTLAIRRHFPKALLEEVSAVTLRAAVYGALAALGVGVALAATMSRRLRRSARQAGQIAAGDLSARLPQRGRDEIAHLARAVNNMADALASRIQAEQEVTANIAHELRTPVAGMVAAAGLLPEGRPAEMVQERAGRLRDLMEDVLEVARLDNGGEQAERQEVELGALARRVVAGVLADRTAEVTVSVIKDAVVETDARRVDRIVTNLVTNALRHGAEPAVVEVDGPTVHVRDNGPGFPPDLLAHGPQRFRTTGKGGLGLGLTIVMGQAEVIGAQLTWTNPTEGGAQATLHLPTT